jgi:hypothetical protein
VYVCVHVHMCELYGCGWVISGQVCVCARA